MDALQIAQQLLLNIKQDEEAGEQVLWLANLPVEALVDHLNQMIKRKLSGSMYIMC